MASDPHGYYFVLAVSNVGYLTFNFLNLNAGWIHRIDSPHAPRAWRCPTPLLAFNTCLSFVNALFLGAGAKVWGYSSALWAGLIFATFILPVFAFRHYYQDGGKFPAQAMKDLGLEEDASDLGERKAGVLPYLALCAGLSIVLFAHWFFELPA
uniref:Amino acid permease/ SLC12A domain-containing protein n=1 Tax=Alexandrium andersonii TaxID=327968 RepID=A0A7S2H0P1_9DINO